jgi:ABC-type phosphate/phosphonate transport system substrate-binding protein
MKRLAAGFAVSVALTTLIFGGCANRPLFSKGFKNSEPIRMTTVDRDFLRVMIQFGPFKDQAEKELKQPVQISSDWDADSIKVHLADRKDYYHLLYLDPVQYSQVSAEAKLIPLAVRKNIRKSDTEVGLIVVPKNSRIKSIEDIKGQRFAFGPHGSPYMFYNVLELLAESNVPTAALKGARYRDDGLGVVRDMLVFGLSDVGVVTQTWWETTSDLTLDMSKLLKDELRIIARTKELPEYVWAATPALLKATQDQIRHLLMESVNSNPGLTKNLKADGFAEIDSKTLDDVSERIKQITDIPPKPLLPLP